MRMGVSTTAAVRVTPRLAAFSGYRFSMAFLDIASRTHRPAEGFYTTEVQAPAPLPVQTFLPQGYEPRYPYPLLVFLHGLGGTPEQILRLAPKLSRRNFVCIS